MKYFVSIVVFLSIIFIATTLVYAATTPSLGQSATFAILSNTYTNTVSGTTLNGDLGYTTGPAVAPTVSGTTHVANGTYSQAGTDQGSALTALNSQSCTYSFPGGAIDLATDTTHGTLGIYTPGVYCVTGAASIGTGGITLSGSGTYIFRMTGALTTDTGSVVTLSGASNCDVFWTPGAATTLAASTTFEGTDIDDSGITIGSTVTWNGRALAFGGTVSTDTDTITVPTCPAPTATPTPTSTPTPTPTPTSGTSTTSNSSSTTSSSGGGSSCTSSGVNITPIIISAKRVSPTSITVSWGPNAGLDDFYIQYGFEKGTWLFNTKVSGFSSVISDLPANQSIWIQVAATDNCAIGTYSSPVLVGGTTQTNSPGFPNTGNPSVPGLPDTGFDPSSNRVPINVLVGLLLVFCLSILITFSHKIFFKSLLSIALLMLFMSATSSRVSAQESQSVLYVPLIGITSVPKPLALPKGPGNVTYSYAVKNFLREVPLSAVKVVDDKCQTIKFLTGDDNNNSLLDYSETWRYTCTIRLTETSQSAATATGVANDLTATHKAYATVLVGSGAPPPLVSIINITKVAYPLSLPHEGGKITFTYKVNNPGIVPLSNVTVADDKCGEMSGKLGDTNGNNLLDVNEVWIYTCTTNLKQTTTNTATVTAFANGLKAINNATITVKVANSLSSTPNSFSNFGSDPNTKVIIWIFLASLLLALIAFFLSKKKPKK